MSSVPRVQSIHGCVLTCIACHRALNQPAHALTLFLPPFSKKRSNPGCKPSVNHSDISRCRNCTLNAKSMEGDGLIHCGVSPLSRCFPLFLKFQLLLGVHSICNTGPTASAVDVSKTPFKIALRTRPTQFKIVQT